jgi:DNA-binding PadR family transcriptional regulator
MNDKKNSLVGDLLRGNTDKILLSILMREDSYGYRINKIMDEETNHRFSLNEATLYTTFKRLEQDDLIKSYWKESENSQPRKYYSITEKGKQELFQSKIEWKEAVDIIAHFIGE